MKIQVQLSSSFGNAMLSESRKLTAFLRERFDIRDICSDGVRLHSSVSDDVDLACKELSFWRISFRRIDNWNVRVAMKQSGNAFGVYFA